MAWISAGIQVWRATRPHPRRADQLYATGRRAIIDLLVTAGQPVSNGDIAAPRPAPRSSAYRHLVDLGVAGVVRRVAANDEFARFELTEDLTEHHHHLLSTHCGKVIDVPPTTGFDRMVAKTVDQVAEAEGFHPLGHRLDVLGLCADCR